MLRAILIALMMFAVAPAYAGKFDDAYPVEGACKSIHRGADILSARAV